MIWIGWLGLKQQFGVNGVGRSGGNKKSRVRRCMIKARLTGGVGGYAKLVANSGISLKHQNFTKNRTHLKTYSLREKGFRLISLYPFANMMPKERLDWVFLRRGCCVFTGQRKLAFFAWKTSQRIVVQVTRKPGDSAPLKDLPFTRGECSRQRILFYRAKA